MPFLTTAELMTAKAAHKENLARLYEYRDSWRGKAIATGAATIANIERQLAEVEAELYMAGAA